MVWSDDTGRRIYRRVKRRPPSADSGLDDANARYILQIAAENPGFTPDEVYAEIHYGRGRHDIPKHVVHQALKESR
ncbi:hypothetical protein AB0L49_23840 [Streptomyces antimycoticus]|uniref:hypothetical protein n=1 Tax=Streptomyces antimycoticus TaxID=68175 RepID=UPI00342A58EB